MASNVTVILKLDYTMQAIYVPIKVIIIISDYIEHPTEHNKLAKPHVFITLVFNELFCCCIIWELSVIS